MSEEKVYGLLEKLGLTEYEAKTMQALFSLQEAEAPGISRLAQVPKTRVYDVLDRLTQKGLIIEIAGRPKKYRVIEADKVFGLLIEDKRKELQELEQKARELKDSLIAGIPPNGHEKIMKVKDRHDFYRILGQELVSAKKSIAALPATPREFHYIKEAMKANPNAVGLRVMGRSTSENARHIQEMQAMGMPVRENDHGLHAYVIDNQKVIMGLSDFNADKPEYHFSIWPDNKPLANALTQHFESLWQ
ncbi:MAG: TrmB family transcriptional regulator [Candidatus Diapherotrites archaeon]|nr:TrmB family transcriptional regulator [Candidatus Diapherotrites archaeon]